MSPSPHSDALVRRLERLPRLATPVGALVLLLLGLMAPPVVAVAALALLVGFVGWLASLSWPAADRRGRLLRVLVLAVLGATLLLRLGQLLTG